MHKLILMVCELLLLKEDANKAKDKNTIFFLIFKNTASTHRRNESKSEMSQLLNTSSVCVCMTQTADTER